MGILYTMSNYLNLEKEAFGNISKKAGSVFTFDSIHLEKLLEISQYSILAFFLALMASNFINSLMINSRIKLRSTKTPELVAKVTGYTLLIVIAAKYIPKIIHVVPFLGWWDPHYKPDSHGEATYGISMAMGLAFYTVMYNYFGMVSELSYRMSPKAQELTRSATPICRMKDGSHIQAWASCDLQGLKPVYQDVD